MNRCGYLYLRGEVYCGVSEKDHAEKYYIAHPFQSARTPTREQLLLTIASVRALLCRLESELHSYVRLEELSPAHPLRRAHDAAHDLVVAERK